VSFSIEGKRQAAWGKGRPEKGGVFRVLSRGNWSKRGNLENLKKKKGRGKEKKIP